MRLLLKALISGLGQMANIWPKVEARPVSRTDLEALRSDTRRIGDDMRQAIGEIFDEQESRAKPVQGPVDMPSLRQKVMARHRALRAYLAKK